MNRKAATSIYRILYAVLLLLGVLTLCACQLVQISFKSSPDGAKVHDGRLGDLGTTPFTREFEKGTNLDLTYTLADYEEEKKSVSNIKSSMVLMLEMKKKNSTYIIVKTNPPGASIELQALDGSKLSWAVVSKVQGQLDPTNIKYELPSSTKELVIEMSKHGFKTRREMVKIDPNKENWFSFPLEKITTEVYFSSTPSGAEVYERTLGFLGQTPLNKEFSYDEMRRLSQGKHIDSAQDINLHLTFSKSSYKSAEIIEQLQPYENDLNKIIHATLVEDSPLKLEITTNPQNAEVYERSLGFLGKSPVTLILKPDDILKLTHKENNDVKGTISLFFMVAKDGYQPNEVKKTINLEGTDAVTHIELNPK